MSVAAAVGLAALGVIALSGGGDLLVRGATAIARLARVTPAVIGLTVVSMGTSLPELVVSLLAALEGRPDVAMGNVVGSNMLNVAIIVGVAALVAPLSVHSSTVRLEWPFMFIASFLALLLARDGLMDRLEGACFLVSLLFFTVFVIRLSRAEVANREAAAGVPPAPERERSRRTILIQAGLLGGGLVLLVVGARFLVHGAIRLAELAGVSERIIALTIVALGTSLPELATSVVAAFKQETELAVANAVGSNIFNILGILGVVALAHPVPVSAEIVTSDMWWMLAFSLLLLPIMRAGLVITRADGLVLLAAYAVYLWLLI